LCRYAVMSNTDESADGTAERAAELKKKEERAQEMPGVGLYKLNLKANFETSFSLPRLKV
jgi:hypothetical protein